MRGFVHVLTGGLVVRLRLCASTARVLVAVLLPPASPFLWHDRLLAHPIHLHNQYNPNHITPTPRRLPPAQASYGLLLVP